MRNEDLSEETNQRDYLEAVLSFYSKDTNQPLATQLEQLKGDAANMYLGFEAGLMNMKGNLVQNSESLIATMKNISQTLDTLPQDFTKVY